MERFRLGLFDPLPRAGGGKSSPQAVRARLLPPAPKSALRKVKAMPRCRPDLRRFGILLLAAASIPAFGQQTPKPDPFAPLHYFVGTWRGDQSGEPGHGTVDRQYKFVLGGKFLQVRNRSTYPPQEKNKKGEVHQDMGMIGYDKARKKFVFRQFHVEGFVNTYVEQGSGDGKRLVFTSEAIENIAAGWRAREIYTILNDHEFTERFELAEPGKDFQLYSEAHLKRAP